MTLVTARTFLTMLTVLVTSITCGCTYFISHSGVSGRGELSNPTTRAAVHDQFGKPDDTRTCPDGRVVESRWIRQQIKMFEEPSGTAAKIGHGMLALAYMGTYGTFDIFYWPVTLYRSEKAKLRYAFVYDEAGQILYLYDLEAPAPVQFEEATRSLRSLLTSQLENEKCASWTATVTDYVQETRQRAACIGYTFSVDEEQAFERMFAIGERVDSGGISCEDGLAEIRENHYLHLHQ